MCDMCVSVLNKIVIKAPVALPLRSKLSISQSSTPIMSKKLVKKPGNGAFVKAAGTAAGFAVAIAVHVTRSVFKLGWCMDVYRNM